MLRKAVWIVFAGALLADSTAVPPAIKPELETEYFRADGRVAHIKPEWEAANADLLAAIVALQKACGDKYAIGGAPDGRHLICAPKPEPPKEQPKDQPKK